MIESAGLLVYRTTDQLEVLLAHPGGPFWASKDEGAWSIPKGEMEPGEDPLAAARREFTEELSVPVPVGDPKPLGSVRQKSGKVVHGYAISGDLDPGSLASNMVEIVWPPRSDRRIMIPEIDRVGWFPVDVARTKLNPAQAEFIDRLMVELAE